ncbi:terminase large subunit [Bifidobacterium sp.]|uniref:terminase large subunit n=1 Tax=Bifidobacterium sp. TaxID=41200 RepID=UPI0039EC20FE
MTSSKATRSRLDLDKVELPEPDVLEKLKISPEVAAYMLSRGLELPEEWQAPKIKVPEPRNVDGAVFSPGRVDRVLAAFHMLRHTQGKWAGKPLDPASWQVAWILAPAFGWLHPNEDGKYVRIINDLYVDVPRKNGKSTLSGGIAVYMLGADGESGAQVVCAASTEHQAGFVFQPVKQLVEKTPALEGVMKAHQKRIVHPSSGSYMEVISSAADAAHGMNLHCFICDELHVYKSADLVHTLQTGRGSRTQPLGVYITTPDAGKTHTIYDETRRYVEQLAERTIHDDSWYGVVWGASETDDPFAVETQMKANPGYGVSPAADYLAKQALHAKNSPANLASYLRLHLGIRTKQETRFITLSSWDRNKGDVNAVDMPERFKGRTCFGGWDLAAVSDLTAWSLVFPNDDGSYECMVRFWTPEGNLADLDKRTSGSASEWVREGFLRLTPGDVTDYGFVERQILQDLHDFDVRSIGYDPWNATQVVNDLEEQGLSASRLTVVRQGAKTLSPVLKELQRLLLTGTIKQPLFRHGGNPVLRWNVDNLAVKSDVNGNVQPSKADARDKIDGVAATLNALSEAMTRPITRNPYETRGLFV